MAGWTHAQQKVYWNSYQETIDKVRMRPTQMLLHGAVHYTIFILILITDHHTNTTFRDFRIPASWVELFTIQDLL